MQIAAGAVRAFGKGREGALIEKLESLGYAIRPEWKDIYWGARTDLPNRTRERDKRKPEEKIKEKERAAPRLSSEA